MKVLQAILKAHRASFTNVSEPSKPAPNDSKKPSEPINTAPTVEEKEPYTTALPSKVKDVCLLKISNFLSGWESYSPS